MTKGVHKPQTLIVMFFFDSAKIDDAAKIGILKAITAYKEFGTAVVRVAGHADRAVTEQYNMNPGLAPTPMPR